MIRPTYKRSLTKRESFRIDLDADEVRTALSFAIDETIPESAAIRVHDDGGVTFCWDVDRDVDWDESTPVPDQDDEADEPRSNESSVQVARIIKETVHGNQDGSVPAKPAKPMQNGTEYEGPSQGPGDQVVAVDRDGPAPQVVRVETATIDVSEDEPAEPGEEGLTPYEKNFARHGVALEPAEPGEDEILPPPSPELAVASARAYREAGEAIARRLDREIMGDEPLSEDATPLDRALRKVAVDTALGPKAEPARRVDLNQDQCRGEFSEGATRKFRCHLDNGHEGPCGPAEGCEPENPPKGRRRAW